MNKLTSILLWIAVAVVGAFSFAALALGRGEIGQRRLARHRGARRLFHRLPLLQQVHRRAGARARRLAADARDAAQRRHGLRADQQVGALRPPLRGDRRRGARWSGRCSRRRWVSCPARCGSWPAWWSPARCRTSSSCSPRCAATASRLGEMIKMELGPCPARSRWSACS